MQALQLYPIPVLVLDYLLGIVMWTLLGRAVLDLFVAPDRDMVIATAFRQITNPFIRLFAKVTPKFLLPIFVPIYVAWWFYAVRFYVFPLIFFGEMGMLSFPMENSIIQFLFGSSNPTQ